MRFLSGFRQKFASRRTAVAILMYHRVCNPGIDPWQLAVRPAHFEDQLRQLSATYPLIPIHQVPDFLSNGQGQAICLSFDDGYLDNYQNALPLLRKYQAPASFLIYTGMTGNPSMFWWDELADHFLEEEADGDWHYPMPPANERQEAFLNTWARIKSMHPLEQQEALKLIRNPALRGTGPESRIARDRFGIPHCAGQVRNPEFAIPNMSMNADQLRQLASDPLFCLGAHTVHHPALDQWEEAFQREELSASKASLESIVQKPVTLLGYPFGAHNSTTLELARALGFRQGLTTRPEPVYPDTDPLAMGRLQVMDTNGQKLLEQVRNLFSKSP